MATKGKQFIPDTLPERYKELPSQFTAAWEAAERLRKLKFDFDQAAETYSHFDKLGSGTPAMAFERLQIAADAYRGSALRETFQRLWLACGNSTLPEIRAHNALRDEIELIAVQIFAQRLAALELLPGKVRQLFGSSMLFGRYVRPAMGESGLRSIGEFQYVDEELGTLATLTFLARERKAEPLKLREQAKAELAGATGVKLSKRAA